MPLLFINHPNVNTSYREFEMFTKFRIVEENKERKQESQNINVS